MTSLPYSSEDESSFEDYNAPFEDYNALYSRNQMKINTLPSEGIVKRSQNRRESISESAHATRETDFSEAKRRAQSLPRRHSAYQCLEPYEENDAISSSFMRKKFWGPGIESVRNIYDKFREIQYKRKEKHQRHSSMTRAQSMSSLNNFRRSGTFRKLQQKFCNSPDDSSCKNNAKIENSQCQSVPQTNSGYFAERQDQQKWISSSIPVAKSKPKDKDEEKKRATMKKEKHFGNKEETEKKTKLPYYRMHSEPSHCLDSKIKETNLKASEKKSSQSSSFKNHGLPSNSNNDRHDIENNVFRRKSNSKYGKEFEQSVDTVFNMIDSRKTEVGHCSTHAHKLPIDSQTEEIEFPQKSYKNSINFEDTLPNEVRDEILKCQEDSLKTSNVRNNSSEKMFFLKSDSKEKKSHPAFPQNNQENREIHESTDKYLYIMNEEELFNLIVKELNLTAEQKIKLKEIFQKERKKTSSTSKDLKTKVKEPYLSLEVGSKLLSSDQKVNESFENIRHCVNAPSKSSMHVDNLCKKTEEKTSETLPRQPRQSSTYESASKTQVLLDEGSSNALAFPDEDFSNTEASSVETPSRAQTSSVEDSPKCPAISDEGTSKTQAFSNEDAPKLLLFSNERISNSQVFVDEGTSIPQAIGGQNWSEQAVKLEETETKLEKVSFDSPMLQENSKQVLCSSEVYATKPNESMSKASYVEKPILASPGTLKKRKPMRKAEESQFGMVEPKYSPFYKLPEDSKGVVVIFNYIFREQSSPWFRQGADQDTDKIESSFKALGFQVIIKEDRSKNKTIIDIKRIMKKEVARKGSFILFFLSHGDLKGRESYFFTYDKKAIVVPEIWELLSESKCKSLIGKPKLIFTILSKLPDSEDKSIKPHEESLESNFKIENVKDLASIYSLLPAPKSQEHNGSIFVSCMHEILNELKEDQDLNEVLHKLGTMMKKLEPSSIILFESIMFRNFQLTKSE